MRRAILNTLLYLFLPAILSGCLDVGGMRLSVDLKKNDGEIEYLDIVSDAESEEGVKADFQGLMDMTYGETDDLDMAATTVSRALYARDGRLNGRSKFIINDAEKLLAEFDIKRNPTGGYFMEVRNGDVTYTGGNGFMIEDSSGPRVIWDESATVIEAELKYDLPEEGVTGLLPYWLERMEWDSADGPDALEPLAEYLGEAITPEPEDNSMDFCPDGACLSFKAGVRTEGSFKRLADFAYIYLYHVADDASLDGFKSSEKKHIQEIVLRNMRECAYVNEKENARCALRNLSEAYSVKISSLIYGVLDSEKRPIDLEEKLKEMGD